MRSLRMMGSGCGVCVSWSFSWQILAGREALKRTGARKGGTLVPAKMDWINPPLATIDSMPAMLTVDA